MSEKTEIFNIDTNGKDCTVTVLHGKAPEPEKIVPVTYVGRIDAPGNYYESRRDKDQFTAGDCVLTVDYEKKSIGFEIFSTSDQKAVRVSGRLEIDHKLERFGINNQDTKYTREELAQLFKFNRSSFNSRLEGMDFVKKLMDFSLKFDQAFQDSDDERGGKKVVIERVIKQCNLPETVTLNLPIFKGQGPSTILVDVLFHVSGSGDVVFYLESPELADYIDSESQKVIDKEVERFIDIATIYR